MQVKGPLLLDGSGTCEQDLQLTSATPRKALKHAILCLSIYHDIPCQAISNIMRCPPGHSIYIHHAMAAWPYHISCRAHQALPYIIPCPPGHTIYHAMPARQYLPSPMPWLSGHNHIRPSGHIIPCDARKAIPWQTHQAIP